MQNSFFSDFFAETSGDCCFIPRADSNCPVDGGNSACVPMVKNCDFSAVDRFPLAMSYVPMQKFENLYNEEKALCRGTLFEDLDLPFKGERGGCLK